MKRRYLIASLGVLALDAEAWAADKGCTVGRIAELPVTMRGMQPLVKVKINDRDATFVADSGAWYSLISPGSAAELGLEQVALPGLQMTGIGGSVTPRLTTVKKFTIVGVTLPRVEFVVGGSEVGSVGLLGQNLLALEDTEFDLAHGAIRLMRNEGCAKASLAYWAKPNEPYSVVETEPGVSERPHIIGAVYVNGIKLRALFDTGAGTSFVTMKAAARLGLKPNAPGVTFAGLSGGVGSRMISTWIGPVQNVKIGDTEEVRNTRLRFGADNSDDFDMLVGADFFLSHRVYWSSKLRKMFITFNGGAVFNLGNLGDGQDGGNSRQQAALGNADTSPAPTDADGFSRRAAVRVTRGDLAGGLADLDQAVTRASGNADILRQRAELHARMGHRDKALDDLAKLLKDKPDDVDAHLLRAEMLNREEQAPAIRADLAAAAAAAAKSSDQRLAIAGAYDGLGDYAAAIAQYDLWIAAHREDSRRPMALNGRCWARALAGTDLALALKDCNAALSAGPHTAAFLDSRGLVRVRMGNYAGAVKDYDEVLAAAPDTAWSLYGRGIARVRLGQKNAAEADLKKARSLNPHLEEEAKKRGIVP